MVANRGVRLNGAPFPGVSNTHDQDGPILWFADRSLQAHPRFPEFDARFDIRFIGGAVMNVLEVLMNPRSMYVKAPKEEVGGCAIWDIAAVSLMLTELGGECGFFDGQSLHLNREAHVFFHDVGLALLSPELDRDTLMAQL